jgi:two-component system, chemotaxis family, chemotaxis protein CheY
VDLNAVYRWEELLFESKTRILIVEDVATLRKTLVENCGKLGFSDVTEALDGGAAWELLQSAEPTFGLILCDWAMPNCTGLELLKRVRADNRWATTPFIMFTADIEHSQIVQAVKAGVTSFVVKPFTLEVLRTKFEEAYKKHAA